MINSYKNAIDYIFKLGGSINTPAKYGIERIKKVLVLLSNPQEKINNIHITGTKGKGSTTKILSSILAESGYKVGMYISPSLININERISINSEVISPEKFIRYVNLLFSIYKNLPKEDIPSTFETFTIIAFLFFLENEVDFSLLEVGLGGRLDATNVIENPLISIITEISYDHQKILGNTLSEIAYEKGGIIKKNHPVIIGTNETESLQKLLEIANQKNSEAFLLAKDFYPLYSFNNNETFFDFYSLKPKKTKLEKIHLNLIGEHQISNASIAIQACMILKDIGFEINDASIYKGIEKAFWPGRLERIKEKPKVILDGAHNGSSAEKLVKSLKKLGDNIIFLFSMLSDKNIEEVLFQLSLLNPYLVITEVPNSFGRRLSAYEIYNKALKFFNRDRVIVIKDPRKAYFATLRRMKGNEVLCVTGSLYLVGYIRTLERVFTFSNNLI